MATKPEEVAELVAEAGEMAKAAASEAAEPEAEVVAEDSDLGNDFAEMDESYSKDFNTDDMPATDGKPAEEPVEETAAAEETAVAETPAPVTAEETPTEETAEPSLESLQTALLAAQTELAESRKQQLEKVEEPSEEVEAPDQVSDESFKAAQESAKEELVEYYALTQEDADKFLTEPEAILPQIAANLHLSVMQSVMQGIRGQLGGWITAVNQENTRVEQEHSDVFEAYPALKDHKDAVDTMVETYRKMNPGATKEDVASKGGAMAIMALGLQAAPAPVATAPAPVKSVPHKPAGSQGRGSNPPAKSDNEFTSMAEEDVID